MIKVCEMRQARAQSMPMKLKLIDKLNTVLLAYCLNNNLNNGGLLEGEST